MADEKIISLDDINYAVYKIGEWENHYEIFHGGNQEHQVQHFR